MGWLCAAFTTRRLTVVHSAWRQLPQDSKCSFQTKFTAKAMRLGGFGIVRICRSDILGERLPSRKPNSCNGIPVRSSASLCGTRSAEHHIFIPWGADGNLHEGFLLVVSGNPAICHAASRRKIQASAYEAGWDRVRKKTEPKPTITQQNRSFLPKRRDLPCTNESSLIRRSNTANQ